MSIALDPDVGALLDDVMDRTAVRVKAAANRRRQKELRELRTQVLDEIESLIIHADSDGDTRAFVSGWVMALETLRDNLTAEWKVRK